MSEGQFDDAAENRDTWLKSAFRDWDVDAPADRWNELDETLSLESTWKRVDQSITQEEHAPDSWITALYDNWNPQMHVDGWKKLNDAISLEQVWTELDSSLSVPVVTRIPVIKLIAATIAMLLMVSNLNDMPLTENSENSKASRADEQQTVDASQIAPMVSELKGQPAVHKSFQSRNHWVSPIAFRAQSDDTNYLSIKLPEFQTGTIGIAISPSQEEPVIESEESNEMISLLDKKAIENQLQSLIAQDLRTRERFYPWTIQVGTQLSVLQEADPSRFTSTVPRFGIAADLSFRHRVGAIQLIHAFGISQYVQDAGKYVNGRFRNTQQHINTLQLSSSVGYNYNRFTFYGGILLSKMLTGLEENQSKITKVYSFNPIQVGATGGVDYKVISFPASGKHISVGAQYQWIPDLVGQNHSFENIHGIRFQAKFSF